LRAASFPASPLRLIPFKDNFRMRPGEEMPTVLLVEDDEATRFAMAGVLHREGYQLHLAASGGEALGVLQASAPSVDVLLLDVHLPDVTGAELCARLNEQYPRLPVIV